MGSISQEDAIPELEKLLERLAGVQAELKAYDAAAEADRKAIIAKYAPLTDPLNADSEQLLAAITELFTEHRKYLTDDGSGKPRKSVVLRGGELAARFAPESLELDESRIEKALRKLGEWRNHSKQPARKLDKVALKKNRALVDRLPDDIARFAKPENLHIKLPKLQLEIKRVLNPLRSRLAKTD